MSSNAPNTKHFNIAVPVPRDPLEYRKSDHFVKRQKYRSPEIKPWIIEELLEEGRCRGAQEPNRFVFEKEILSEGNHLWRLVVALNDDAFLDPGAKHRLVTAYCTCCEKEEDLP